MKRIGSDQLAVADPFEIALAAMKLRGETLDRTLQQQAEFFGPDDEEIVRDYLNRRGE